MNLLNEKMSQKKFAHRKKQMIDTTKKLSPNFFSEQTLLIRGVMDPIYITLVNQPTKKIGDKRERERKHNCSPN